VPPKSDAAATVGDDDPVDEPARDRATRERRLERRGDTLATDVPEAEARIDRRDERGGARFADRRRLDAGLAKRGGRRGAHGVDGNCGKSGDESHRLRRGHEDRVGLERRARGAGGLRGAECLVHGLEAALGKQIGERCRLLTHEEDPLHRSGLSRTAADP
jgi:hypothetical protein